MPEHPVRLFTDNNIGYCELASPPGNVMNASFFDLFSRLSASFGGCAVDGMVICSSGRHFSSGADLGELRGLLKKMPGKAALELLAKNHAAFEALSRLDFPIVAAISGCCLGAALELALACRFRICTKNAIFALPESTFGFMPGCGGTVRLPALVGAAKAIELTLSGRTFGPDEAQAWGLVDMIVEKKMLLSTSVQLIKRMKSPGTETMVKL
jgi:enoyl-CoA hydratase/carnithine racemase